MKQKLDHHQAARLLDQVNAAVAALAHAIPSPGAGTGTVGGALTTINTGLHEARARLHAQAVAAGLPALYRSGLRAGPELAAACRVAALAQIEAEEAAAEARRRTWGGYAPRVAGPSSEVVRRRPGLST